MPDFYEFFAGGGMARAGLGAGWQCLFANDFDHKKSRIYAENWGNEHLKIADVRTLTTQDMPGHASLVWGSFPCQDLSLAGGGAGLKGDRSGTFWPFWTLVTGLIAEGRLPKIIVLENVCGTLTSHNGQDFTTICAELQKASYKFGAVVIDAALFVPQSRPRLFVIAIHESQIIPNRITRMNPAQLWHPRTLRNAYDRLPAKAKRDWVWWDMPSPAARKTAFSDLIEDNPPDVKWHTLDQTGQILGMMSDVNREKVERAKKAKQRIIGCIYKRTRWDEFGRKVQRAEVRFDDMAGCLRTPAGGSSRQLILVVDGNSVKSRLISSRETARLMGLPEEYRLPENYNEAYHLTGDGVVIPVVRHLAAHIFEPILDGKGIQTRSREAA